MIVNTITEAKAQLSFLIEKVLDGEEVIIKKAGKPVVVLNKYEQNQRKRKPGVFKGKIKIADDFDELPTDIAAAFGIDKNESSTGYPYYSLVAGRRFQTDASPSRINSQFREAVSYQPRSALFSTRQPVGDPIINTPGSLHLVIVSSCHTIIFLTPFLTHPFFHLY